MKITAEIRPFFYRTNKGLMPSESIENKLNELLSKEGLIRIRENDR